MWKYRLRNGGYFVQGKMSYSSLNRRSDASTDMSKSHYLGCKNVT